MIMICFQGKRFCRNEKKSKLGSGGRREGRKQGRKKERIQLLISKKKDKINGGIFDPVQYHTANLSLIKMKNILLRESC